MKNKGLYIFLVAMLVFITFSAGFLLGRNTGASKVLVSYSHNPTVSDPTKKDVIETNKININTANEALLCELPGIGPKLAQRIIEYRQTNGDFTAIEELTNVSGIGEKTLASLKNMITVGG